MDEVIKKTGLAQELALPNELPKSPDLSHLPDHVLRSNAVETLLQQNEELMSRLSVSLRRLTRYESLVDEQENKVKKFKHHYEVLKDEVSILKEKSDQQDREVKLKNKERTDLIAKNRALDYEYSNLFQENKKQTAEFLEKIGRLSTRLQSHIKYKNNISPLVKNLKRRHKDAKNLNTEFEGENKILKDKLSSLTTYIQEQANSFSDEKEQLLRQFDEDSTKIAEFELQLNKQTNAMETLNHELVELRNYKISSERANSDKVQELENLISVKTTENNDFKRELKKLKIENLELKTQQNEISEHIASATEEQNELKEQLENTQMFFASLQKKFEKEQAKTSSLQKINRRLSQEMNTYRSTIQSLKNFRDQNIIESKGNTKTKTDKSAINKIEDLIFEIERDFR